MSVISKRFANELAAEKAMREAYLSAQTRTKLTNQVRTIRTQRGWSQGEFANILRKPQSNVSRIENREYGAFTLTTLFELANAFDCGLVVEFVPYDEFLRRTHDLSPAHLQVPPFSRSMLQPLCQDMQNTWYDLFSPRAVMGSGLTLQSLNPLSLGARQQLFAPQYANYDATWDVITPGIASSGTGGTTTILTGLTGAGSVTTDLTGAKRSSPPQIPAGYVSPAFAFAAMDQFGPLVLGG